MPSYFFFRFFVFFLFGPSLAFAQSTPITGEVALPQKEAGLPFVQNFKPKDYQGMPQNWAIIQDRRGVMYFGNNNCVLEYDGSTWRKISLPGSSTVHALALDEHGQIFVGGDNDLGYLAPDGRGQMRFISLLAHVPEAERNFGRVWNIVATQEGIFFETDNNLYGLQKKNDAGVDSSNWQCRVWKSGDLSYELHAVHHQILASLPQKLFVLRGDSLHLLTNHAAITNATINLILPYPKETGAPAQEKSRLLIGTRSEGLFLYDGVSLRRFECEANAYLRKNNIYHGTLMPDGRYAFATLWGGAVLMDRQGRLLQIINKAAGLHNENILYVFPDRDGGLWLATDGGLARIEASTPISFFQESLGINGIVLRIIRHRDRLYVGTSNGLAYLADPPAPGFAPVFKFVPGMQAQTRVLLSDGLSLLVGGSEGFFRLNENGRRTLIDENDPDCFLRSKKDPARIYVGLVNGLAVLQGASGKSQRLVKIPGYSGDVYVMAEDTAGVLWVAERQQGLSRLELPRETWGELTPAMAATIKIERFGPQNGVPEDWVGPEDLHGRILISTAKGLRRFDPATRTFPPDSSFGAFFADTSRVFYSLTEDAQKQIWMVHSYQGREEIGVAVPGEDGSYTWLNTPFSRISEFGYMNHMYVDPDQPGVMWLACEETLVRYDAASPAAAAIEFPALVRRVIMKGDSVMYGGAEMKATDAIFSELSYANNALRFEYAAPTFDNSAATRYQYCLEEFEDNWSAWTAETKKEYTNLPEGDYRFRVRAHNVYERLSNEGVFAFTILPPWYRTWWAYSIYLLFAGVSVFGLVRWRVQALQQKARQLEATIAERTAQVVEQKNRLEEQSHQLQEMDRVKSRFFANISHEFRTPLTLILGPLERVLHGAEKHNSPEDTRMMHRNASNLLRLVNQLLDLTKLEAGKLRLQASEGDLVECLKSCIAAFDSLAKSKKMSLRLHTPVASLAAWFNRGQVEEIFYNLLSNAFKFTPEGGEVSVQLSVSSDQLPVTPPITDQRLLNTDHWSLITVKDTGIGIPADKLPYVFDRFYQAESASTRKFEGTGIGLALVKELLELHYGKVEIKSEEGKGTEVTVRLPLGRKHLQTEEIEAWGKEQGAIGQNDSVAAIPLALAPTLPHATDPVAQPAEDETIILVVEDNADMRAYIRRELETDYTIIEAQDGKEGVEKALEIIPDLVISDVMMPVMDGYALCDRLKSDEKTSHIPVVLLTARAGREDKLEGLKTGADDYLTKPFDAEELQTRAKNLIAVRRKMQEKFRQQMVLQPSAISITSFEEAFLKKAVTAVEAHLEDESFSPEDLAREVGMSRAQFYRKLRALTGQPAGLFIRSLRLERAADLLKQGAGNITEIAYKVGFSSHPYFTKCFHEHFGMSPKEYVAKVLHI